jgi:hypothetical protein
MRIPALTRAAALLVAALLLTDLAAAQGVPQPAPANPLPPSQQKAPQIPPAQQEANQKDKLPVITPPAQIDPNMVKPAPDVGPNSTPVVKPPPNPNDGAVPK